MNAQTVTTKQSVAKGFPKVSSANKVGFFSGTFDPVHTGHVEFVLEAIKSYGLTKVLLLPEEQPREKSSVTDYNHRLNMLKIALNDHKNIELIVLSSKTFSVESTLPVIRRMEPTADLVFLCGSDVVRTFVYRWEGLEVLLSSVEVIIGLRENETQSEVNGIMEQLGIPSVWNIMNAPKHHLASTMIRQGTHTIEDIHPQVAKYIQENNLYS